jgi:3-phenylpropionate/trans-cinnamate dioxygenase ferredoxin reductase subunit
LNFAERLVVAGAGLAGLRTAAELRARNYTGRITMIGAEERPPYDRPPLSKKVLTDNVNPSLDADFGALDVDFRPGETATGLTVSPDGAARAVVTNRESYSFENLVIATGAAPVALPGPGRQRFLRTYDDALELRELLRPGLRLAIVGAGWIGGELATAAAALGASVTVVEAGPAPLAAALGEQVGSCTSPWYAAAGVVLRTRAAVESVEDGGLALAGGEWLPADEIVTAVGVRPAVGWLAGSGISLASGPPGGVLVDAGLRASLPGVAAPPRVYAAGDCAAFESRLFGTRMRVEHWDAALHAPEVVAANIIRDLAGGADGGFEVYDPVPYFWSEQFGRMVQYVGHHSAVPGAGDRLVWRGDPSEPKWSACWLDGSRLTALLTVGRPRDMVQARKLIADRAAVDPAKIADPAIPVRDTLA